MWHCQLAYDRLPTLISASSWVQRKVHFKDSPEAGIWDVNGSSLMCWSGYCVGQYRQGQFVVYSVSKQGQGHVCLYLWHTLHGRAVTSSACSIERPSHRLQKWQQLQLLGFWIRAVTVVLGLFNAVAAPDSHSSMSFISIKFPVLNPFRKVPRRSFLSVTGH